MAKQPRPILHLNFARSAAPPPENDATPMAMKRPPRDTPAEAPAMRNYMVNLESRLVHHMQRHAKNWVDRETNTILRRWNAPILKVPSPRWAPPRDLVREARRYAEQLVMDRVQGRLKQFHTIRLARGFVHDPLGDRLRAVGSPDASGPKNGHKQT